MTIFANNKRKRQVVEEHYSIMGEDIIEKIRFIESIESLIPNPNRFFEKLICFKETTMDLEKVLFFIARDKYNGKTSFRKSIEKNLYSIKSIKGRETKKSRATYVKSIIDNLKENELINKIEKICPNSNCSYEFKRVPVAGVTNVARLSRMLDEAAIAFLIMTAEDEQADGKIHARMNVVHEVGLFQGRLGFNRAIVLLENKVEEFSNIHGIQQIRFDKGNIRSTFGDVLATLNREFG